MRLFGAAAAAWVFPHQASLTSPCSERNNLRSGPPADSGTDQGEIETSDAVMADVAQTRAAPPSRFWPGCQILKKKKAREKGAVHAAGGERHMRIFSSNGTHVVLKLGE